MAAEGDPPWGQTHLGVTVVPEPGRKRGSSGTGRRCVCVMASGNDAHTGTCVLGEGAREAGPAPSHRRVTHAQSVSGHSGPGPSCTFAPTVWGDMVPAGEGDAFLRLPV